MSYSTPPADAHITPSSIPTAASGAAIDGRITRTWRDDREEVLRHRWRKDIIRVIFPRRLLPILRARVR